MLPDSAISGERDMHLVFIDLNNVVTHANNSGVYFSMDWLFGKIDESIRHVTKDANVENVHGLFSAPKTCCT